MSMLGVGALFFVTAITHSYGMAGAASATLTCSSALVNPWLGRLADRHGQHDVLIPAVIVHCAAIGLLIALGQIHAPIATVFVTAAATGASMPPASSLIRARWTFLLAGRSMNLNQAYSFEAVVDELVFMAGPVLVTVFATAVTPWSGLACSAALALTGCLLLAGQRGSQPAHGLARH